MKYINIIFIFLSILMLNTIEGISQGTGKLPVNRIFFDTTYNQRLLDEVSEDREYIDGLSEIHENLSKTAKFSLKPDTFIRRVFGKHRINNELISNDFVTKEYFINDTAVVAGTTTRSNIEIQYVMYFRKSNTISDETFLIESFIGHRLIINGKKYFIDSLKNQFDSYSEVPPLDICLKYPRKISMDNPWRGCMYDFQFEGKRYIAIQGADYGLDTRRTRGDRILLIEMGRDTCLYYLDNCKYSYYSPFYFENFFFGDFNKDAKLDFILGDHVNESNPTFVVTISPYTITNGKICKILNKDNKKFYIKYIYIEFVLYLIFKEILIDEYSWFYPI